MSVLGSVFESTDQFLPTTIMKINFLNQICLYWFFYILLNYTKGSYHYYNSEYVLHKYLVNNMIDWQIPGTNFEYPLSSCDLTEKLRSQTTTYQLSKQPLIVLLETLINIFLKSYSATHKLLYW